MTWSGPLDSTMPFTFELLTDLVDSGHRWDGSWGSVASAVVR